MAIWIQVRTDDDMVTGIAQGAIVPTVDPGADHYVQEIDATTAGVIYDQGLDWPGTATKRWMWDDVAGEVVEVSDVRALVRFTPSTVEDRVGQPDTQVQVEVLDPDTETVRTGFSQVVALAAANDPNYRVGVNVQNGLATLTITKTARKYLVFEDQLNARFIEPLTVNIVELNTI